MESSRDCDCVEVTAFKGSLLFPSLFSDKYYRFVVIILFQCSAVVGAKSAGTKGWWSVEGLSRGLATATWASQRRKRICNDYARKFPRRICVPDVSEIVDEILMAQSARINPGAQREFIFSSCFSNLCRNGNARLANLFSKNTYTRSVLQFVFRYPWGNNQNFLISQITVDVRSVKIFFQEDSCHQL